ncbi:SpoIIE family protein phosphatase [Bacteriovorax sp. Seq25_V]|uniref:SpoIIE family protein phosphatase n=1 Tax=Bacteriovorax sp. Seq25_V TaxID=1201288 RepID=UPI00042894DD|nr:SpoIIE family protein phosphatase [Bacteriovorax sp. Seq25_V]
MTVSLICAIAFYTFYASSLFSEDKKAYIFENSLATSTGFANEISSTLSNINRDIEILNKLLEIKKYKNIEDFIKQSKVIDAIWTPKYFFTSEQSLTPDELSGNGDRPETNSHIHLKSKDLIVSVRKSVLTSSLEQNRVYRSILFSKENHILYENLVDTNKSDIIKNLREVTLINSVKILELGKKKYLFSVSKTKLMDFRIFNLIDYDQAFSVTDFLIQKSILFGLFILFFISAIAMVFAKSITNPIDKLFIASQELAKGNFDTIVEESSKDEIGHLAKAFNYMTSEIKKYMEQMKEKLRLENEVQVAKLVQENFFPQTEIEENSFEIMAFNTPASECGGDWWNYYKIDNKLITIIADATGHGVPAALLTASINTSFNTIKFLLSEGRFELTPEYILNFLNKSLTLTKTDVLLTAFVCVFDLEKLTLSYSNASHLDALYIPQKNEALEKSDIIPLIEAKGARLGHKSDSVYSGHSIMLNDGDTIILKTDGIIECVDKDDKPWGIRRFLKTIIEISTKDTRALRNKIIEEFLLFCSKEIFEDDLTLVCIKVKK